MTSTPQSDVTLAGRAFSRMQPEQQPANRALRVGGRACPYEDVRRRRDELVALLDSAEAPSCSLIAIQGRELADDVSAVLACLARGNPFLPLSPHNIHPARTDLVRQSRASAILDRGDDGQPIVELLVPEECWGKETARDVAYVMPTSGTTGRPKLVRVGRDGLAHHARRMSTYLGLRPDDVVLQASPFTFDVWMEEVLTALHAGATLTAFEAGARQSPRQFLESVRAEDVTVLNLPASHWSLLTDFLVGTDTQPPSTLRAVVVGSEAVPAGQAERWLSHVGDSIRLVNAYGLTETTITSAVYDITDRGVPSDIRTAPIGSGLPGTEVSLSDWHDDHAGQEIVVSGAGLALGYLDDDDEWRTRTFTGPDGRTCLRTGDIGVALPTGDIVHMGRRDRQVQVAGVRVEPARVERALDGLTGVAEAAVVAEPGQDDPVRLHAFVVKATGSVDVRGLRGELREILPSQAVPQHVWVVDRLPVKANGKRDHARLRSLARQLTRGSTAGRTVHTVDGEVSLSALLEEELGPHDSSRSFVDNGGTSLAAMRILTTLEIATGQQLSFESLVSATPLREIVGTGAVATAGRVSATSPVVLHVEQDSERVAPLTPQQLAVWFHHSAEATAPAYESRSSLRIVGPLDVERLRAALRALFLRHGALRTAFEVVDGSLRQTVRSLPDRFEPLRVLDPTSSGGAGDASAFGPRFKPHDFPLSVWTLHSRNAEEHVLYVNEYHLIHDGLSFGLLVNDLCYLYNDADLNQDQTPVRPDYIDYARTVASNAAPSTESADLQWWVDKVSEVPDLRCLKRRHVDAAGRAPGTASAERQTLEAGLCTAARDAANRSGVTLYAFMLSAFVRAVGVWAGQQHFAVGVGVANRRRPGTSGIVGMFVNTMAIPVDSDLAHSDRTEAIAKLVAAGSDRQHVPFARVVAASRRQRIAGMNPLYQTVFSFDDAPIPSLRLGDSPVLISEHPNGHAKADLNVVVVPRLEQRRGRPDAREVELVDLDEIDVIWEFRDAFFEPADRDLLKSTLQETLRAQTLASMTDRSPNAS